MSFHNSIVEAIKKSFGQAVWTSGQLDPDLSLYFRRKVDQYHKNGAGEDGDGDIILSLPVKVLHQIYSLKTRNLCRRH